MLPDYLTSAVGLFARENAVFFATTSAVFLTTTLILGIGWLRRQRAAARATSLMSPSTTDVHLVHLARAVDAIAIEVERVGEAQRFGARGRIDEITPSIDRRPFRTPTPH